MMAGATAERGVDDGFQSDKNCNQDQQFQRSLRLWTFGSVEKDTRSHK